MEFNGYHQMFLLCSTEQINVRRFGTTFGRVNDDSIFFFGCTIPLSSDGGNALQVT